MSARSPRLLLLLLMVVGLASATTASGAATPWETWTNPDEGFRITIPKSWFLVPNTVAKVKAEITELAKLNEAPIGTIYAGLIATAQERKTLTGSSFYAFAYSTLPITTSVSVARSTTTKALSSPKALPRIASSVSFSFSSQGRHVTSTKVVSLPAGKAAYIAGTYPSSSGLADFATYIIDRGTSLYELSFSAYARDPDISATSTTIATIAQHFAFT